jgi:flavorubredoxin
MVSPYRAMPDVEVLSTHFPIFDTGFLAVNAFVIKAAEPVLVDTGMRMSTVWPVPMHRTYWLNSGESISAGDRTLMAVRPPLFDNPTTIGVFDSKAQALFSADCFGAFCRSQRDDTRVGVGSDQEQGSGTLEPGETEGIRSSRRVTIGFGKPPAM